MDSESILTFIIIALGCYLAWNIGANDVSNAMGTSVGSGALTLRRAVYLAALLEFCGAFLAGGEVLETIQKGLISPGHIAFSPKILVLGMGASLLGTGLWLQIATYFGWPVSTTHAIVGGILGFTGVVGGFHAIQWKPVLVITMSWVFSPAIAGLFSFALFSLLQKRILYALRPLEAAQKLLPFFTFFFFATFSWNLLLGGFTHWNVHFSSLQIIGISMTAGGIAGILAFFFARKTPSASSKNDSPYTLISVQKALKHLQRVKATANDGLHEQVDAILGEVHALSGRLQETCSISLHASAYVSVEALFARLQILSACFIAFAHGANDVANAIGPLAAIFHALPHSPALLQRSSFLLAMGGFGIVLGLATWGWRVIETVGKKITQLTPTRGFCAEFGAAATILFASKCGLPISTTHCLVGAILGVGLARGMHALNLHMLKEILLSWVITIPASTVMSVLGFFALKALFGSS